MEFKENGEVDLIPRNEYVLKPWNKNIEKFGTSNLDSAINMYELLIDGVEKECCTSAKIQHMEYLFNMIVFKVEGCEKFAEIVDNSYIYENNEKHFYLNAQAKLMRQDYCNYIVKELETFYDMKQSILYGFDNIQNGIIYTVKEEFLPLLLEYYSDCYDSGRKPKYPNE